MFLANSSVDWRMEDSQDKYIVEPYSIEISLQKLRVPSQEMFLMKIALVLADFKILLIHLFLK
jgi:hypothetical protein